MKRPYMNFYPADYLADTAHLTLAEHGAYLLLICHYWRHGGLPKDEAQLARICHTDEASFAASIATVRQFFDADWRHERIDRELQKSDDAYLRRAKAGQKGGNATAMLHSNSSNAPAMSQPSESESKIERKKDSSLRSESKEKRKTSFPTSYQPNEATKRVNAECGFSPADLLASTEDVRLWAVGNGHRRADWDATHQGWIRRSFSRRTVVPVDFKKRREEEAIAQAIRSAL